MGAVVKCVMLFDEPPGKRLAISKRGFLQVAGAHFPTWWPSGDGPTVTGWAGGPRADRMATWNDDAVLDAATTDLATGLELHVAEVRRKLRDARVFNWRRDPFTLGAYSYGLVGGAGAAAEAAAPIGDAVYFAGEATDDLFPATVAGALRSGYRAATEILAARRR